MKNKHYLTFTLLLGCAAIFGQNKVKDFGLELQAYPTGIIPGFRFEKSLNKHDVWSVRLGAQFIDHRDQGKHDDEKGFGYGGSAAFKHYFNRYFTGPTLAARLDFWRNTIKWEQQTDMGLAKGESEVRVLQPTAEIGWAFAIGDDFVLTPALAVGFEFNIKTKGEETGEGAIVLIGATAAYRL